MSKSNLHALSQPEMTSNDPLHELIRQGARDLIARAVETELEGLLSQYADIKTADGRQAVVRNGYLPKRTIQTGVGDVEVQVPKVRDRSGAGIRFNSHLLPPYLKRARSMDELIPWLYLRGISSGDFQEALSALVGEQAKGLSANTVSRLKAQWLDEHKDWQRRDLSQTRYVYWWADGVYSNVRLDDRLCLLVIIGVTEHGHKELVAVEDGHRESEASWRELLTGLKERGLEPSLELRMAALLHDIGKPDTFDNTDGKVSFHHHEVVGAKLARKRLRKLKYPKATTEAIGQLVYLHMRFHGFGENQWTDSAVRRYVTDAGDLLPRLHKLVRADCTTRNAKKARRLQRTYDQLEERIEEIGRKEDLARVRPDLDGNEIMEILGLQPGPEVGQAWSYLKELRLEHGPLEREDAIAKLREWWDSKQ